jgi:transcriptional regulator with XRE-family HTH domain
MTASEVLGKRIEHLRKQKGWSQLDLSLESDVNKNYICDLEKGRRNPSLEILERIAIALNISLEELFKGVQTIPGI